MEKIVICMLLLQSCILFQSTFADEEANENPDEKEDFIDTKSAYESPVPSGEAYLAENFDDEEKFKQTWILSEAKKDDTDEDIAKYDGTWAIEEPKRSVQEGDLGLVLKSKARHAAIAVPLSKPFYFKDKPLIVQYEVNFQKGQECGGAYLKLLTLDPEHEDLKKYNDKTPYSIMFGPDKCGNDHKLHFIFRHKNPLNGSIEEKHCKKPKERLEDFFKDKQPHLYTLILRPDNTFEIKVDNTVVNDGSLLDDFTPPVNPPLEIEDPNDTQPEDWDDREKIPDPLAVKPEDWDEDAPAQIVDEEDIMPDGWLEDEPAMIPNPDSVKPEDWDVEMDGEWEPPEIPNPKCADAPGCGPYKQRLKKNPRYKGKWLPPLINNPNYKGKWKPRLIHNPEYFNDEYPFRMAPIFAVGFELWSMSPNILFDNIIITDDEEVAKKWADDTFEVRRVKIAEDGATLWGRMMKSMNYKPGYWVLYFIYCCIPFTLYAWYLYKQATQWAWWRNIATFTAEHPWIWAVYILVSAIPLILIVYCCCFSGQEKDDKEDDKEPLHLDEDFNEDRAKVNQESAEAEGPEGPEGAEGAEGATGEEEADGEQTHETDEIIESEKDKTQSSGDGPRRRKPNKE